MHSHMHCYPDDLPFTSPLDPHSNPQQPSYLRLFMKSKLSREKKPACFCSVCLILFVSRFDFSIPLTQVTSISYVYIHISYTCLFIYTVYLSVHIYIYTHSHEYLSTQYIYICNIYICIYICIYKYVCIYINM